MTDPTAAFMAELERTIAAAPQRVEATDDSGAVQVVLGQDGLPESIQVAEDWLRLVGSEALGDVVTQASVAAVARRGQLWSEALRQPPEPGRTAPSGVDPSRVPPDAVRPPRMLMEDVLALTDEPIQGGPAVARATGVTALGKLSLSLDPSGTVSCTADAHWASQLTAEELTDALDRVLTAARAEFAGAAAARAALGERVDDLYARLRGLLRSLS